MSKRAASLAPSFEIIKKHVPFGDDINELIDLRIVDFGRQRYGNERQMMDMVWKSVGNGGFSCTKGVFVGVPEIVSRAKGAPKFPANWGHGCGTDESSCPAARSFWNWFYANKKGELNLTMHPTASPDFWGTFTDGNEFRGDFGVVSAFTGFLENGIWNLSEYDLWISVETHDWRRQTILECNWKTSMDMQCAVKGEALHGVRAAGWE